MFFLYHFNHFIGVTVERQEEQGRHYYMVHVGVILLNGQFCPYHFLKAYFLLNMFRKTACTSDFYVLNCHLASEFCVFPKIVAPLIGA